MMIETLLIDDEALARNRLRRLLDEFDDIRIVGEADSGSEAIAKIEAGRPELIFLDVQMPDLDGFGVLRAVDIDPLPLVIFVTAYDQYAVEAFDVSAIDYLMKPVRRRRLESAIGKAREMMNARGIASATLNQFLSKVATNSDAYHRRLPVRSLNRILVLNADDITALSLDSGQVRATTSGGEFWTKYTAFSQLEGQLDPAMFLRVHRQTIVNLNHVREVTAFDNSTARLTLSCGHRVSVSRNQMKRLRQVLDL